MSKREWTGEQREAIEKYGSNLLVAAGAGSGKTSVLVERVVQWITQSDDENAGIDRLLIVTFSRAAASELRERIGEALMSLLAETEDALTMLSQAPGANGAGPDSEDQLRQRAERIRKQQILLSHADISTIHSFCTNVIRNNLNFAEDEAEDEAETEAEAKTEAEAEADKASENGVGDETDPSGAATGFGKGHRPGSAISPDAAMRIGDEAELELMMRDALEEVLEEEYAKEGNKEFEALIESFGDGRSDRAIESILLYVYRFVQSYPWPEEWLAEMAERLRIETEQELYESDWYREILEDIAEGIRDLTETIDTNREFVLNGIRKENDRLEAVDVIGRLNDFYSRLSAAQLGRETSRVLTWEDIRKIKDVFDGLSCLTPRAPKDEHEEGKAGRKAVKAAIEKVHEDLFNRYFCMSVEDVLFEFKSVYSIVRTLGAVVTRFAGKYNEIKQRRGILDFNDLEHLAVRLLVQPQSAAGDVAGANQHHEELDFRPTQVAQHYRRKYEAVLVDEYQDSNLVQEYILRAVSRGDNLFMVGDVKQSIYRFRQAQPELFMDKYRTYTRDIMAQDAAERDAAVPVVSAQDMAESSASGKKILLYKNFRSEPHILDFINVLFGKIMSEKAGELEYSEDEWLIPGLQPEPVRGEAENDRVPLPEILRSDIEIHIISKLESEGPLSNSDIEDSKERVDLGRTDSQNGQEEALRGQEEAWRGSNDMSRGSEDADDSGLIESDPDNSLTDETAVSEARLTALRIAELMKTIRIPDGSEQGREPAYRDIAILMRAKSSAVSFAEELKRMGIPAYTDASLSYFTTYEVHTMLSVLAVIDNPLQDVRLLNVMLSPIFSFTPEDVAWLKAFFPAESRIRGGALYHSLKRVAYAAEDMDACVVENTDTDIDADVEVDPDTALRMVGTGKRWLFQKAEAFVAQLELWRTQSSEIPVSALVWRIMRETDFYLHVGAMPDGVQRQANLRLLFDYARQYEKISYKGIFNFIRFITRMIEKDSDFSMAVTTGEGEDAVKIMSIHKSKGLEFPIVILAGCGRNFNQKDASQPILLHREKGFGPLFVDLERRIRDDSIPRRVISRLLRNEAVSEEMRILYVALTRAKSKLCIVGTVRQSDRFMQKIDEMLRQNRDRGDYGKLDPVQAQRTTNYLSWLLAATELRRIECACADDSANRGLARVFFHTAKELWEKAEQQGAVEAVEAADTEGEMGEAGTADEAEQMDMTVETDVADTAGSEEYESDTADSSSKTADDAGCMDRLEQDIRDRLLWKYPHAAFLQTPLKTSVSEMIKPVERVERRMESAAYRVEQAVYGAEQPDMLNGSGSGIGINAEPDSAYSREQAARFEPGELRRPAFLEGRAQFDKAQIGTYTHLVLEKADFKTVRTIDDLEKLIEYLVAQEQLTVEQAAVVSRESVLNFLNSEAGRLASAADKVYKEFVFTMRLSYEEYERIRNLSADDGERQADGEIWPTGQTQMSGDGQSVLVQGCIDCWFRLGGSIVLIDYKTGVSAEKDVLENKFGRYHKQMELYAMALQKATGIPVGKRYLFMLSSGKCLSLS